MDKFVIIFTKFEKNASIRPSIFIAIFFTFDIKLFNTNTLKAHLPRYVNYLIILDESVDGQPQIEITL